jgi:signal transduction histidine kinase
MYARWAWLIAAASTVTIVMDTMVVAMSTGLLSAWSLGIHGWPLVNFASAGSAVLGAVIVASYPRHPIGWLLAMVGSCTSISLLLESYARWVVFEDGPGSRLLGESAAMLAAVTGGALALAALTIVFLLVPGGSFMSRRWRWVADAAVIGYASFVLGVFLAGPETVMEDVGPTNPVADLLLSFGILVVFVALITSVIAMVIRLRRSVGEARQQIRLILLGAASIGVSLLILLVGQGLNGGKQTWWSSMPLFVGYAVLVVCITVAVLRYRLYDVQVIISRAVVLTAATVFVAAGYIAIVVVVGLALGQTAEAFWPSLLATAAVALAFQPVRTRVVRFADRLAYGERAVPYVALSEFTRRLGQSPAAESLLPAVAEAAAESTEAALVRVDLDLGADRSRTSFWPPSAIPADAASLSEPDLVVPVSDDGGTLGGISVWTRPGRSVRRSELDLLRDLAEQAAVAFRNARLESELMINVVTLDAQTAELEASRRRIIEVADEERRRLEAAIARDVLPTLVGLDSALRTSRPDTRTDRFTPMIDQATAALESLRELTRGIYPTTLTRSGLGPALSAYFGRLEHGGDLIVEDSASGLRFTNRVENAIYFCCVEAVGSGGGRPTVRLSVAAGVVAVELSGVSVRRERHSAMIDRVAVCGGTIRFEDDARAAGRIVIAIPHPAAATAPALVSASDRPAD